MVSLRKGSARGVVATACAAALVAGCGAQPSDVADGTVSIGLIQPLTGTLSGYGAESQAGFTYIVDKINSSGGIRSLGGAKIEVVVADDASKPAKAATEARRLIGHEDVSLVVGSLLTPEMAAVSPVADQLQVPVLSMFAGGTNSEYLYTMGFPYGAGYAATFADFIEYLNTEMDAGLRRVALSSSNYEAGQSVDQALGPRLRSAGLNVVGSVPLDQGATDFGPALLKLQSMNPDVVTGLVSQKDGIKLHQARAAANANALFVGGTGGYSDPGVWHHLGPEAARKTLAHNLFGMTGFNAGARQEHMQEFLAEVRKANLGVPIGQNFVQGAQAARVVQHVLELAGSADPAAVHAAIPKIEIGPDSDHLYLARSGGIDFNEERRMTDVRGLIIQWNNDGTQDVVWPEEFAERKPRLPASVRGN